MKLEGIHHVTCITADAPRNVEFYAGTLGLRLVKKTVNQDEPSVYHLFYADERGTPGAELTFFEFPGTPKGRAGDEWEIRGERRGSFYAYDEPPAERGLQGAGTVHHVAWASHDSDHEQWRERVLAAGAQATPVIDRFWFHSVYFREPSGVLFE